MHHPPPPAALPVSQRADRPRHVGIIMDGNGRWARSQHLPRVMGHRAGVRAIRPVLRAFQDEDVHILTLYAFSTENWSRPGAEVRALMRLFAETIDSEVGELHANGVQVRVLGEVDQLAAGLRRRVEAAESLTAGDTRAILNVAINYGGRHELALAVRELASRGADLTAVDEAAIDGALYTAGLPDPDLIIRTAGEQRLSNFLIWQAAYAELVVVEEPWPDFGPSAVRECLAAYAARIRRFGGVLPEESGRS